MNNLDGVPLPELRKFKDLCHEMMEIHHRLLVLGEDCDKLRKKHYDTVIKLMQQVEKCDRISKRIRK